MKKNIKQPLSISISISSVHLPTSNFKLERELGPDVNYIEYRLFRLNESIAAAASSSRNWGNRRRKPWVIDIEDLDDGVFDAVLEAEEEVGVAEADVCVNSHGKEAEAHEGEVDVGGGAGFVAFTGDTRVSWESCGLRLVIVVES
ncbi:homolog of yeast ADA2 2B [Striga asiatica]|uniref:Homolog of yeast ADA2 2B n=1 Tax=Striga asiatica TaxID=4170 RepID=A0A5A7RGD4_STRAF|nr:homolog of yeast ADA2 2B [Striga asiatica]